MDQRPRHRQGFGVGIESESNQVIGVQEIGKGQVFFFCHMAKTFGPIFPYLKGFHLNMCGHLLQRNEEGWKIRN